MVTSWVESKPGQQVQGHPVLDHLKQGPVEEEELVQRRHGRVQGGLQVLVLLVKEVAEGGQQGILPPK